MNRFSDMIGGTAAIEHIQNALRRQEISHAYILSGEPGSGRMMLARSYAAALLCQNPVEENGRIEPCGVCPACLKAAAGSHADLQIYSMDRLSKADRGKSGSVGIKLIRLLVADVQIKPYEGGRKVYIIPDADRMTAEAQNALLKTLEEPPAYAVLILLANGTQAFLPTILSRCVILRLYPLGQQELTTYLVNDMGIPEERAAIAAGLSHGNPGMARRIASSDAYQDLYHRVMDLWCNLSARTAYDLATFAKETADMAPIGTVTEEDKETAGPAAGTAAETANAAEPLIAPVDAFLDLLQYAVRDVMVCKSTGVTDGLILRDQITYSSNIAQRLEYPALQRIQEELLTAGKRRRVGGKEEQILEVMLLNMREIVKRS